MRTNLQAVRREPDITLRLSRGGRRVGSGKRQQAWGAREASSSGRPNAPGLPCNTCST